MEQSGKTENVEPALKSLYWIGGAAALLAAVIFRRNIGAEVSLFSQTAFPQTVLGWFQLLQTNRLVGLSYLNLFDVVNYGLLGLMFLSLYWLLKPVNKGDMTLAAALGLAGMTVSFATNSSLSMLSLSDQYMAATSPDQQAALLAAGWAMLAMSGQTGVISQSTGAYTGFLLMALARLFASLAMRHSNIFPRSCSYLGIAASILDLIYCLAVVIVSNEVALLVGLGTLPLAGVLIMIWHFWIGWKLIKLIIRK